MGDLIFWLMERRFYMLFHCFLLCCFFLRSHSASFLKNCKGEGECRRSHSSSRTWCELLPAERLAR